jgi:hypothetical protein
VHRPAARDLERDAGGPRAAADQAGEPSQPEGDLDLHDRPRPARAKFAPDETGQELVLTNRAPSWAWEACAHMSELAGSDPAAVWEVLCEALTS